MRLVAFFALVLTAACQRFEEPIARDLAAEDRFLEVEAQMEKRQTLAARLVAAARESGLREDRAVIDAAEARARANLHLNGEDLRDPMKVAALVRAEERLRRALVPLIALRDRDAALGANPAMRDVERELLAIDEGVARATEAYDRAAREYGEAIANLPRGRVNRLTGKRFLPRVPLSASAAR